MTTARVAVKPIASFSHVEAEERCRLVIDNARPAFRAFFLVVFFVGVMEWMTRPTHRSALLLVGGLYVAIALACAVTLRRRAAWAVPIAVGGVSALCIAMLSYSPMVRGSGELCVLAITVLMGGFTVMFPLGLRNQLLASIAPVAGYAAVLQLGTITAFPPWYSASALATFLFVLAVGARTMDQYRSRILQDAFRQAALAAENGYLRDEARAADRAKSDLMAILSHELRTPLGAIRNFSEVLVERQGDIDEKRLAECLQHIRDQSIRAVELVQTMLEFGRIQSGRLELSVEEFDLAEMIERLRNELPAAWKRPQVKLLWEAPPAGIRMRTDRGKLEAVVRNLLHNALRHTTSGSVTLMVTPQANATAVGFAVTDTGEGIDQKALPQIFDRYSRSTSAAGGFGLGLFIVKRFSELLGGRVAVQSTLGVGTCFEAVIPVTAPVTQTQTSQAA